MFPVECVFTSDHLKNDNRFDHKPRENDQSSAAAGIHSGLTYMPRSSAALPFPSSSEVITMIGALV